ncbi:MAG: type I DNA topoisomerase [Anaerolineaceae bacterium]|nr:type I DNA topoisomerase [Anaerolineaceae bacterium]MDD4042129.1 type I DNA topoisomerase [Anaerolineaceae bacterium]MDD4578583.1 type I DNA topoisomerase [Anaerolineaceae bacterium]
MEAYCLKCKEKREIAEPQAGFNARGAAVTTGTCQVCGTKMYRIGATPAHEGMEKPVITKSPAKAKTKKTSTSSKTTSKKSTKSSTKKAVSKTTRATGKPLVIVESPAKARTIGRFLGKGYDVVASVGHVRDLLKSQLSVDVENGFEPKYRVPNEKKEVVKKIKSLADGSKKVFLATDPDREGEAIAWHLVESAEIDPGKTERVVFHEITKNAIAEAFENTRDLDMDLVDAQQARRILDRLVGYSVSPILWAKVKGRLSAGRVQSVALRLVVEREREIDAFIPVEYWSIHGIFNPDGSDKQYRAKLAKVNGKNLEMSLENEEQTLAMVEQMKKAAYNIANISISTKQIRPGAPFITSTLQQEASRRLGFLTRKTMTIAQQLYEGLDMGTGEETGLITYMRTDSVHVSTESVKEARSYIRERYGENYLPEKQPQYRTRAVSAQEAHEAIRPTSVNRTPESLKKHLTRDQYALYRLIWQRFVASQMNPAKLEITTVEVEGKVDKNVYLFRATGNREVFAGFRAVYRYEKADDENGEEELVDLPIEVLEVGQKQNLVELEPAQHFTQPPPRYSEATLIQALEENQIGRPSTYSPIISTIQSRGYVSRENKRLFPTEIGYLVNDLVVEYFPGVVDLGFTSQMEAELDKVAEGKQAWADVIREFYTPFSRELENAKKHMPKTKIEPEKVGRLCPEDGGELVFRMGKFGKFISCSNFPKCRYTEPWLEKIGVTCPTCGIGDVIEKRSKKGRKFYGCSRYPECDFTSWDKPVSKPCPSCSGVLVEKGNAIVCSNCKTRYPKTDREE